MAALSPLSFLARARRLFAERIAVIDGPTRLTYGELADRVDRQRRALRSPAAVGLRAGDRVAVLAPNSHQMLEAHFSVPAAGLVLVALNVRLSGAELAGIVAHSDAALVLFEDGMAELAGQLGDVPRLSMSELEKLTAAEHEELAEPLDEHALLAINYTSGTTGRPKGVMYEHRGAYLQALAMAYHARLRPGAVHLWTLPMFHCNGWCFPWAVTAAGGTHLCLRRVDPAAIWQHLRNDGVTHLNAAPTVLSMIAWHEDAGEEPLARPVSIGTGGAPPSPKLLLRMEALNFEVTHLYGLTETFGPVVVCDWQPEWDRLPADERARLAARQGGGNISGVEIRVVDGEAEVPADGDSTGEVQVRGNNVMRGYYRDAEATAAAFAPGGWLRTGDAAVTHANGYIELRDRLKDVIISGGENIASIEVEQAIASHPAVLEVAVVSMPDSHWGEVPVAYVELHAGENVSAEALIDHVRGRLARFKAPKKVAFRALPRTATGKIQKYALRDEAWREADKAATT